MSPGRRLTAWFLRLQRRNRDAAGVGDAEPVNGLAILDKVAELPVSTWSYTFEPGVRHLGPMAQDFSAAFGLGDDDRVIDLTDANGVAIVSIQALYRRVQALEAEVARLSAAEPRS